MAAIDLRIQRVDQLLDSLDSSPVRENERALNRDVEDHVIDIAGEYPRSEPLRIIVHAPVSIKPHSAEITRAIHAHFKRAHAKCRRRYRQRMRIGRTLLIAGTTVLGITLILRVLLGDPGDRAMIEALREGLLILGWVALWRPLDILLFERLEEHRNSALLDRLTGVTVDFEFDVI